VDDRHVGFRFKQVVSIAAFAIACSAPAVPSATPGTIETDFLAHYSNGEWKRIPISGGLLRFCRDDEGWDIDSGYLAVSNHGVERDVSGPVEISAKDRCASDEIVLEGHYPRHRHRDTEPREHDPRQNGRAVRGDDGGHHHHHAR
jgi:hypothetical protein